MLILFYNREAVYIYEKYITQGLNKGFCLIVCLFVFFFRFISIPVYKMSNSLLNITILSVKWVRCEEKNNK